MSLAAASKVKRYDAIIILLTNHCAQAKRLVL